MFDIAANSRSARSGTGTQ